MKFINCYEKNGKIWYEVTDDQGNLLIATTNKTMAYMMMEVVL